MTKTFNHITQTER